MRPPPASSASLHFTCKSEDWAHVGAIGLALEPLTWWISCLFSANRSPWTPTSAYRLPAFRVSRPQDFACPDLLCISRVPTSCVAGSQPRVPTSRPRANRVHFMWKQAYFLVVPVHPHQRVAFPCISCTNRVYVRPQLHPLTGAILDTTSGQMAHPRSGLPLECYLDQVAFPES